MTKADAEAKVKAKESRRHFTRSEVWGTAPTRRSDRIAGENKILATRTQDNVPNIVIPWAYSNAIHTPEGKLWKDAMDYKHWELGIISHLEIHLRNYINT